MTEAHIPQGGELAPVIPIDSRRVERINGIPMKLGRLSVEELREMQSTTIDRLNDAQTDLMIINEYLADAEGEA